LYRGRGLVSGLIKTAGLSVYSHAAVAGWTNGNPASLHNRLMAYEMRMHGGQGTTLSSHVAKWPGRVDVYRVSDTHTGYVWDESLGYPLGHTRVLDRKKAVAIMRDFCRPGEFGMTHLLWVAMLHAPLIRFFCRPPTNDQLEDRSRPPYCSEAVAWALRKAFTDIVKNTPDHYTAPGDIARSPLLHYMFTLTGPPAEERHAI